MQLILGISQDGFIAKSEDDNMDWLKCDKNIFKLLSSTNGGVNLVSEKTGLLMPQNLPGRQLIYLSRKRMELNFAFKHFPNANLLGGQTLAKQALQRGMIETIFITEAPINLGRGIRFELDELILDKFEKVQEIKFGKIKVHHYILK